MLLYCQSEHQSGRGKLTLVILQVVPFDVVPSHQFGDFLHVVFIELSTCFSLPVVDTNLLISWWLDPINHVDGCIARCFR